MKRGPRLAAGVTALMTSLLMAGCTPGAATPSADPSSPAADPPSGSGPPTGATAPAHVLVVVFENKDASDVLGSDAAPYLNGLAGQGRALTNAHGEAHPSQPNYMALFSGSTHGITDDSCPISVQGANLAGQLLAAGQTFVGYSEDLPAGGFTGCSAGDYARKHNPWVNFASLPASVNQPLSALPADYAKLPTVAFVIPNLCNDMHDCSVTTGDQWAKQHLSGYVAWARTHNSLLLVSFDEDEGSSANHIPSMVIGPMVQPGTSDQWVDHYNILRTLDDMYGLPPLGEAATSKPIQGIWRSVP